MGVNVKLWDAIEDMLGGNMTAAKQKVKQISGYQTNREFAEMNQEFKYACERGGVKATKRQAAKWRQGRGIAFQNRKPVKSGN